MSRKSRSIAASIQKLRTAAKGLEIVQSEVMDVDGESQRGIDTPA